MSKAHDDLNDRVLVESDRTCCVCRMRHRPVQIHHIDEDHSNNERENLAVLCKECHDLSHTDLYFGRNLNAGQIRLYDSSWREICAAKLFPEQVGDELTEYEREVALEISLKCHRWKNAYMILYPGQFREPAGEFRDIWERIIKTTENVDSGEEWNKYEPLFREELNQTLTSLTTVLSAYGDAVSTDLKVLILRTIRQLETEQTVYLGLGTNAVIKCRVEGVVTVLAGLARTTDAIARGSTQ